MQNRLMLHENDVYELLNMGRDITHCDGGIAIHKKYYSNEEKFFNLVITFYGDAKTTRGFAWEAQPECKNMVLQYGKQETDLTEEKTPKYKKAPVSYLHNTDENVDIKHYDAVGVSMAEEMLFYKADIDDLDAGTTYYYRIGDKELDVWSDIYSFETETEENNNFSFIAVTDPQGRSEEAYKYYHETLNMALTECPDAKFILNAGDFVDNALYDDWWNLFFDASGDSVRTLPLMTCIGNHEHRGYGSVYYNLHFNNPQNALGLSSAFVYTGGSMDCKAAIENLDNTVYSFDYGNAHFAVLNTGSDWNAGEMLSLMELQKEWLRSDLTDSDKKWKIVVLHRGIYTEKVRDDGPKKVFLDVIDECGVDLVLQGHDHTYMRSYQMKNDKMTDTNIDLVVRGKGTVYTVLGSAALKRYDAADMHPYVAVTKPLPADIPGYTMISISDEKIEFMQKLNDGTVMDKFKIIDSIG